MAPTGLDDRRRWVLSVLDEYEVPLTRFAMRLLGDEEAARDVVQHAFLRLCDRSDDGLHDRVAPWLFTVCRNKAVDMLRRRGRMAPLGPEAADCPSRGPDPAVAAERSELYRRLARLVDALPPSQREAVGLWAEGFSYREIAEISDRSEGNVRVLVHRALKQLRSQPLVQELLERPAATNRLRAREAAESV
ncbi:MAG: sigma-70 family RNA polymerase sigma factor [Pirellulales bacterium]|nr:sigma-70 family RNA polymerase sigma factor [Pirellulales bacterium]